MSPLIPPLLLLLLPLLLRLRLAMANEDEDSPIHISKCCWMSQLFDVDTGSCVSKTPEEEIDEEYDDVLKPPIDEEVASWLPDVLRSRTVVPQYGKPFFWSDFKIILDIRNTSVVEEFLRMNVSAGLFVALDLFDPPLDSRAVWKQDFCFDRSLHSPVADLLITWVNTRQLNKCCPLGERLTADAHSCEAKWHDDWLPPTTLANVSGIRHKPIEIGFPFPWNVAVPAVEEDDPSWRLMAPPGTSDLTVWVKGSFGGREVQGVAGKYCFDAVAPGEFSPLVLLAAVADVRKCCPRTQRFSMDGQQCEAVSEEGTVDMNEEEVAFGTEKLDNSTWIPPTLKIFLNTSDGAATVKYNMHEHIQDNLSLDADIEGKWVLEYPDDTPLEMWLTGGSQNVRHKLTEWCFENQAGRGRILLVNSPCDAPSVLCLPKCCPMGSLLEADGTCRARPSNVRDWDPVNSAATPFLPASYSLFAHYNPELESLDPSFATHNSDGEGAAFLLQENYESGYFRYYSHCADLQLGDNGPVREVFAYFEYPRNAGAYVVVRPLQLLAVLFLAVGLAVILRDENTRRSLHGCTLACHAFCLLFSNSIQIAWFFTHQDITLCELPFASSIYFFLVAAGVWLNVVSINMTLGFRRPLGARAAMQRRRPIWRSLALWSAYGWGMPALLTALSIYMYINQDLLHENYTTPTFFETRTCHQKLLVLIMQSGTDEVHMGPFFYYYLPMSLLIVANGVCLMITTSTIMAMKKEITVLNQMGTSTLASRSLQNTIMYVKLLLSAGLVELAVEGAAWATRPPTRSGNFFDIFANQELLYTFQMVATFVDVARALAVLWLAVGRWRWPWAWPCSCWRRVAAGAPRAGEARTTGPTPSTALATSTTSTPLPAPEDASTTHL